MTGWLLAVLFVSCVIGAKPIAKEYDNSEPVVDKHDSEYQEHMKKVYNDDKEGIKRGASFACGICHMVAATTKTAVQAKVPEAKIQEILLTSCQRMKPTSGLSEVDAKTICKRVIQENLGFIVDGISTDYKMMCFRTEPPLCEEGSPSHDEFMRKAQEMKKQKQQQKEL